MSSEERQEDVASHTEGNIISCPENQTSKRDKGLESESTLDGSGDPLRPSQSSSTLENTTKIQKNDNELLETHSGDHQTLSAQISKEEACSELEKCSNSENLDSDLLHNADISEKTFLDNLTSVSEEIQNEDQNEDEDIVLRYVDDEEAVDVSSSKCGNNSDSIEDRKTADSTEIESMTVVKNDDEAKHGSLSCKDDIDKNVEADSQFESESKSFEFDADGQEDLLSEIDAQIANLEASLSKAENEKADNVDPNKLKPTTLKTGDVTDGTTLLELTEHNIKKEADSIIKHEINMDDKISEMEEEALLKENDDIVLPTEDLNKNDYSNETKTLTAKAPSGNIQETDVSVDNVSKNKQDLETVMEIDSDLEKAYVNYEEDRKEVLSKSSEILVSSSKLDDMDLDNSNNSTFAPDSSSFIDEKPHGVNKPNVMLEIPTQELINLDESMSLSLDTSTEGHEVEDANIAGDLTDDKAEPDIKESSKIDMEPQDKNKEITSKLDDSDTTTEIMETDSTAQEKPTLEIETMEKEIATKERSNLETKTKLAVMEKPDTNDCNTPDNSMLAKEDKVDDDVDMKKSKQSTLENELESAKTDANRIHEKESMLTADLEKNLPEDDTLDKQSKPECVENQDVLIEDILGSIEVHPTTSQVSESKPDERAENQDILKENTLELTNLQPSTSQDAAAEVSDDAAEAAEATDSLGLLAESSRVREEDDGDPSPEETSDHDDDDDDLDPDDDNSNLLTAEQSEDSAAQSESDVPKHLDNEDADKAFDFIDTIAKETEESFDNIINEIDNETNDAAVDKATSEIDAIDKEASAIEGDKDIDNLDEEDKGYGLEIANIVSEDTRDGDGQIDIDDDIVFEELEVGDSTAQSPEAVDTALLDKDDAKEETSTEIPLKVRTESKLREILSKEALEERKAKELEQKSPSKKKLAIAQPKHVVSIVDLEESSSDDERKEKRKEKKKPVEVTTVNISKEIEVMSSGDNTSEIYTKGGEIVINVPKTTPLQRLTSRLNTSELTIKTAASKAESTLVIPEAKIPEVRPAKFGALEVFNLDSDDEDSSGPGRAPAPAARCLNPRCAQPRPPLRPATPSVAAFYECRNKKRALICQNCLHDYLERSEKLVDGIKNLTPLLQLVEVRSTQELVEISDSDSEDEAPSKDTQAEKISPEMADLLEISLAAMINATWDKYNLDSRLKEAQDDLMADLDKLEKESAEVNAMLEECQQATDKLRGELYRTFDVERHSLPSLVIYDTPDKFYIAPEGVNAQPNEGKRRLSSASESQAKKPATNQASTDATKEAPAITKLQEPKKEPIIPSESSKIDDDKDVSVVQLSAEAAPADLPPPGEAARAPLLPGHVTYAMRHAFGSWIRARVLEVTPKGSAGNAQNFTMCRVKFENKVSRNAYKLLPARCLAYFEPSPVRMTIGTRVIALSKDTSKDKSGKPDSFYSGVVAEVPNPVNNYRYLVFFDDGYAQYVAHRDTRPVCESSSLVWEEVHPFSREFVREYLLAYPERPMVRLHTGQSLKTEWNGKWWLSRVISVDASLVQVYFEQDKRTEWIYRGSTRLAPLYLELQAAEKHRARPLPRNRQNKLNMPYVEYTRMDVDSKPANDLQTQAQQEEMRRQRSVAKKSTTPIPPPPPGAGQPNLDAVTSRVVYYTPKNAVKPYKMSVHTCTPRCRRTDVLALRDLRTYNPLAKPLLSGWERQIVRYKGHKEVMYRAPCGRRLRTMRELHQYLRAVGSDMGVDLFDFGCNTHCLAEFVLNKCIVGKKDLSHAKENVPVPCVNYYDDSLPEFCSYNTERTPTAGVPLNLDPEFLCGCDCTDDCEDKSKCACWKMTQEGARTIGLNPENVGYVYKRLPEPLPSGIYECNVRCKCRQTCLNRVAQHPLQLKLQVFKTLNRGWGIRSLNDVPKGAFLCIYAGNLLTDATANLDGLNEGDEYLAELDYIEVVEQMKEGYEEDIPENDKKLDQKEQNKEESDSEESESEEETQHSKSDAEDGNFEPGFIPGFITEFSKRLRKREKKKQKETENKQKEKEGNKEGTDEDCITISDDEELREPSSLAAKAGMGSEYIPKHRSVRTLFGEDEACYIMDAKVQGNIGRYLNHSCSPNVFVQNVFVDTHDPRFPWVAFFALSHIRAGTELTWNYNYDVGSVPGKALYCYCGAPNCRGRLL